MKRWGARLALTVLPSLGGLARAGDLFVSDAAGNRIVRYNGTTGGVTGGMDPAYGPGGLAFSAGGNLLVASSELGAVIEFNPDSGTFVRTVAYGYGLANPEDLVIGPGGNIFVVSRDPGGGSGRAIMEFDGETGAFVRTLASPPLDSASEGSVARLGARIAFGPPRGNLFALGQDGWNNPRILEIDRVTGQFVDFFARGRAGNPTWPDLLFGPDSFLYISNASAQFDGPNVVRYGPDREAQWPTAFTRGGGLTSPGGIAFEPQTGGLYVLDLRTRVVRYNWPNGELAGLFAFTGLSGAEYLAFDPRGLTATIEVQSMGLSDVRVAVAPADQGGQVEGTTPLALSYPLPGWVTLTAPEVPGYWFEHWMLDGIEEPRSLRELSMPLETALPRTAVAMYRENPVPAGRIVVSGRGVAAIDPITGQQERILPNGAGTYEDVVYDPRTESLYLLHAIEVCHTAVERLDLATGVLTTVQDSQFYGPNGTIGRHYDLVSQTEATAGCENPFGMDLLPCGAPVVAHRAMRLPNQSGGSRIEGWFVKVDPVTGETSVYPSRDQWTYDVAFDEECNETVSAACPPNYDTVICDFSINHKTITYDPTTGQMLFVPGVPGNYLDPYRAAVDPEGNLIVTDLGDNSVYRYHRATGQQTLISRGGLIDAPRGVAVLSGASVAACRFPQPTDDPTLALLVSSSETDQVLRYDGNTGAYVGIFAQGGGLDEPRGLTRGPNGNLFVASHATNSVIEYDGATGAFVRTFVSPGAGELDGPSGLTFGPNGNLFATSGRGVSNNTAAVLEFHGAAGSFVRRIARPFNQQGYSNMTSPVDLVFDDGGNLLAACDNRDWYDGGLYVFGAPDLSPGLHSRGTGMMGLTFGPGGRLFYLEGNPPDELSIGKFQYRGDYDTYCCLWDPGPRGVRRQFVTPGRNPYVRGLRNLTFGPNGNLFAVGPDAVYEYNGCSGDQVDVFAQGGGLSGGWDLLFVDLPTVCQPPIITDQPDSAILCAGGRVELSLAAEGVPPPRYQWRKEGVGIAGATGPNLEIEAAAPGDSGPYDVEVSTPCGSIISDAAVVTIWPTGTGDANGDGARDGRDIDEFVSVLLTAPSGPPGLASCAADLNSDGMLDQTDVVLFAAALLTG